MFRPGFERIRNCHLRLRRSRCAFSRSARLSVLEGTPAPSRNFDISWLNAGSPRHPCLPLRCAGSQDFGDRRDVSRRPRPGGVTIPSLLSTLRRIRNLFLGFPSRYAIRVYSTCRGEKRRSDRKSQRRIFCVHDLQNGIRRCLRIAALQVDQTCHYFVPICRCGMQDQEVDLLYRGNQCRFWSEVQGKYGTGEEDAI